MSDTVSVEVHIDDPHVCVCLSSWTSLYSLSQSNWFIINLLPTLLSPWAQEHFYQSWCFHWLSPSTVPACLFWPLFTFYQPSPITLVQNGETCVTDIQYDHIGKWPGSDIKKSDIGHTGKKKKKSHSQYFFLQCEHVKTSTVATLC